MTEKLKLRFYKNPWNIEDFKKSLETKGRYIIAIVLEESATDNKMGVHVFSHGHFQMPIDLCCILETIGRHFGVIIPGMMIDPNAPTHKLSKREYEHRRRDYIA